MKNSKIKFFKSLRYISLTFVIAFGFITIVAAGGGSGGGGESTSNPTNTTVPTDTIVNGQLTASHNIGASINLLLLSTVPSPHLPQTTRLYLSGSSDDTRCAAIPPGYRGGLCPANPIPVRYLSIQYYLYTGSPANWVTTLSGDLRGTDYGLTLQLAMPSTLTCTGKAEIILRKGATETVLFASEVFTVNSNTFKPFTFTGAGTSANGVSGDQLILRVSCLSGCYSSSSGLRLLLAPNPNPTSFIDIPSATINSQALESTLSDSPYLDYEYDPAMEEKSDSAPN